MRRLARATLIAASALLFTVTPLFALDCAPYISGYYAGGPATGYLIGQSKFTLTAEFDFYFGGGVSQEVCVGTYQMLFDGGVQRRVKFRCDTYAPWGLF